MKSSLQGKKVITVDDSATIRALVRSILEEQGAQVEGAESGEKFHHEFGDAPGYDLILLDLILPDVDGISLLRSIRQHNTDTAIVMLTGVGGVKSALTSVHSGADGYIEKEDLSYVGEHEEFCFRLEEAIQRREGLCAQKELENLKADFYAMVTHDLRSPAATLSLAVDLLQDELASVEGVDLSELLETMELSLGKMLKLINDYLDYSEIDAGYLTVEPEMVDLASVLDESTKIASLQAQAKGQQFRVELETAQLNAWLDGQRIKQIFDNLIINAIKYTPESGEIVVRLYRDGADLIFQVQDTGFGMTPEQIQILFDKYQRGSRQETHQILGTGLGLPIVKEIATAHGGSVWAESAGANCGSTFTVRIPFRSAPPRQLEETPSLREVAYA